jgi:anti-sigma factor RsiW
MEKASPIETCEAETKLVGDYVCDNLDAWHGQAFESHLAICPECAAFLATYKKTIMLTRSFLHLARTQEAPKTLTLCLPGAKTIRYSAPLFV